MKRYIASFIIILFFQQVSLFAQTQSEHFEHLATGCTDQDLHPTKIKAIRAFVLDKMGFKLCTSNCPLPINSRQPHLLNPNDVIQKIGNSYCIEGKTKFRWNLAPTVVPGPIGIEPGTVSTIGDLPGGDIVIGGGMVSRPNEFTPEVIKVYPNPNTGKGELIIRLREQSNLAINIQNIAGTVIKKLSFPELAASVHTIPFDLTENGSGVYYLSISANDELIETVRLVVL